MNIYGYVDCNCSKDCKTLALYKLERREEIIQWVLQGDCKTLCEYPGIVYLGPENFTEHIKKFIEFSEDHLTPQAGGVI